MKETNVIDLGVVDIRPITGENGQKLSDLDMAKEALKHAEEYENKTGKPAPIDPSFKTFLEEMVEACDPEVAGENVIDVTKYKEKHIVKTIPDYSMLKGVV